MYREQALRRNSVSAENTEFLAAFSAPSSHRRRFTTLATLIGSRRNTPGALP
jgi:hypothetical protein